MLGDLVAFVALMLSGWSLYLQHRRRIEPPVFELVLHQPPSGGTNALLELACASGALAYAVTAEVLSSEQSTAVPAALALIAADAEEVAFRPGGDVYRRYDLGKLRAGERRTYSIQPDPGISGRDDNRMSLRLIARSEVRLRSHEWRSTYVLPLVYPNPSQGSRSEVV